MRHVFIINPVSGKENAAHTMGPLIEEVTAARGIESFIEVTSAPRDAAAIARRHAAMEGPVRLYSVGGDGTLNEIFNGAYSYGNAEVASFPCGSGNDFIRSFGEPEDFLDVVSQIDGTAIPIDLMEVDEGVCAAITSTGLDAEVAYNIPKYRRIPLLGGTMAYNISILEKLLKPLGKQLKITIDGQQMDGQYLIAAVCNGQTYGGGYRAAPDASLQDGLLDVVLVKKISRLLIAKIIGKYKKGEHMSEGDVIPEFRDVMLYRRAREVTITPAGAEPFILNVDGECGPALRLYAKALPLATKFVLPKGLAIPNRAITGLNST